MNKLNLMMGIPGSGKSYWITNHMTDKDICISRDAIRFTLLKDGEDYFSHEPEVFRKFLADIQHSINENKYENIFVDATHLNAKSRNKLLCNLFLDNVSEVNVIYLKTPLNVAIEGNETRTGRKYVPKDTILSMYKSLKEPDSEEKYINSLYIVENNKPIQRKIF